jgi:hypothetical protein
LTVRRNELRESWTRRGKGGVSVVRLKRRSGGPGKGVTHLSWNVVTVDNLDPCSGDGVVLYQRDKGEICQ